MSKIYAIILITLTFEVCYIFARTCPLGIRVNITDGKRYGNNIVKDVDVYTPNDYFIENGTVYGCICSAKKCISKCCAEGTMMTMKGCTERKREFILNVYRETSVIGLSDFHLSTGLKCKKRHALFPKSNPNDSFFIQPDGRLFIPHRDRYMENDLYCVDYLQEDSSETIIAFVCDDIPESTYILKVIGMYLYIYFFLICFNILEVISNWNAH